MQIVKFYYQIQQYIIETQRAYRRHFNVRNSLIESMIRGLISRFQTQGSVIGLPRIGRPRSVRNEATVECVR